MTDLVAARGMTGRAFWTSAAVPMVALWASGAPTPVYPLYGTAWHLAPSATTAIFAVYPLALVIVLAVFGDLSDVIGRRRSMLAGLFAIACGAFLFAIAPSFAVVLAGRLLMGVGVGLSLSPATAAMVDHAGPGASSLASSVTTAATALGLTLATVVGGALVQYGPSPLHASYWVLLGVVLFVAFAVSRLPEDRDPRAGRWRPHVLRLPGKLIGVVAAASSCVAAAYAFGALELSLGADIGERLVGTSNAFVVGLIVSVSSVVIGVVALLAGRLSPVIGGPIGGLASLAATAILVAAGAAQSLALFLAFAVLGGVGYSLLFGAGLAIVGKYSSERHRAATLSTVYLIGYLLQGGIALGLGAEATSGGLPQAVAVAVPVVGGAGGLAVVLVLVFARPRQNPSQPAGPSTAPTLGSAGRDSAAGDPRRR